MKRNKIECRPIVSGNITTNPMLKFSNYRIPLPIKNAEFIDKNGFMIGNRSRILSKNEIKILIHY